MKQLLTGFLLLSFFLSNSSGQDSAPYKALQFNIGLDHGRLLDRHASPLVYTYSMPHFSRAYFNQKPNRQWRVWLQASLGNMARRNDELRTTEVQGTNTYAVGLGFSYLKPWKQSTTQRHLLGGSLRLDLISDFEAIAEGPWITAQGRVAVDYRFEKQLPNGHQLSLQASLPVLGIVARQPFHFIPRTAGQAPAINSFLKKGTSIASWNKYQRLDFQLSYQLPLGNRWTLAPSYNFSWFRYSEPKPVSIYQQQATIQLSLAL